jgi:predicted alpha-1,2-mannosidase
VNVLQGTASITAFSRGNTLPIAALPFGMAHWTIASNNNTPWMFDPGSRRIEGFRCTHQLSPWLSDYGQASFLPCTDDHGSRDGSPSSSWSPERAQLHPYSFRLLLARYRADAEIVPTDRCAILAAHFEDLDNAAFRVAIPQTSDRIETDQAVRTMRFTSNFNEGGVPVNFATYYVVRMGEPWTDAEVWDTGRGKAVLLKFNGKRRIEARIATSFLSYEQAERNLRLELGEVSFEELRARAADRWNEHFRRVEVEGGTERQQRIFDSCLYRALLFPREWHEPDEQGKPHHFSAFSGKPEQGVMYADHGYWDVYRAWYPWMSIVFPDRLAEILQAWTNAYTEGGWMPQFPAPGYRACMTGSLIDSVFADAAVKGIRNFDLVTAYAGLKKHATMPGDPDKGYGRRGIADYLRLGYVPVEGVPQSVAETVDAAYGDFCIAQIAKALGKTGDAEAFTARSRNWRKLFDPQTGFLRGKHANGDWLEPFDEFAWGSPYVEGSAWQHRWDVPHDLAALIEAMGGNERAVAALDKMLALPPVFHVGVYGQEIHEMSEMAAVDFGQYAQSNQPVHHLLYIFALAGRPDRTQYWVRRVMNDLYSEETFPGDEDTGAMAAWFLMSAMGFYPVCPGKAEYVAGSPLFKRITLCLPGGRQTVIEAQNQSDQAVYVGKLLVDGKPNADQIISHEKIAHGSRITFRMQSTPAGRSVKS